MAFQWIHGSSCPQQPFLTWTVTICSHLMVSAAMLQKAYAVLPGAKILFFQSLSHPMSTFYSIICHNFSDIPLSWWCTSWAGCISPINEFPCIHGDWCLCQLCGWCGCLEWNSPIGVPLDAWWTIVSMMVFCVGCKRVHSHDGHSAHLNIHGQPVCRLPINEGEFRIIEVSDPKGKGKAHKLWWSVCHFLCFLTCFTVFFWYCPMHSYPYLSSPNTNPEWLTLFFFFFFPLIVLCIHTLQFPIFPRLILIQNNYLLFFLVLSHTFVPLDF